MLEKLAYWCVLLQLPIYIAQKDMPGGLHWEQTVKGIIFFWWALVQNIVPVFSGSFADKYSHKKTMIISVFIIATGYFVLATQKSFYPFLFGTIILGFGSGMFKPALQGSVAKTIDKTKSKTGWAVYFMLLNLAVFFGPPLSKFLKEISWGAVFIGSGLIILLNLVILIFLKEEKNVIEKNEFHSSPIIKNIFINLLKPRVGLFVIIMSGFTIIYMQFYETLPNFIYDWTDTSGLASALHLPKFMLMETTRGTMISYEWLYNLNSGLVFLGVVIISWWFSKINRNYALLVGIFLAGTGLFLSGATYYGSLTVAGIIVYTFGEMLTNPKFAEQMSTLAGKSEKALYMSYLNISLAIGLGGGSLIGGWLYKNYAEKASLAVDYIQSHYGLNNISSTDAFNKLIELTKLNPGDLSLLLWKEYQPWLVWLPFFAIGILSCVALYFYSRKFKD
ncbi:MAG: MFS transporter [Ignavibacteriae bacterium]|nr:MFS transporter [Ignavibacteriota bacterium]